MFAPIKGGDYRPLINVCLGDMSKILMSDKVWFGLDCAQCLDGYKSSTIMTWLIIYEVRNRLSQPY